jgi:hypothetical protein
MDENKTCNKMSVFRECFELIFLLLNWSHFVIFMADFVDIIIE